MLYYLQDFAVHSTVIVVIYTWLHEYLQMVSLMASNHITFYVACDCIDLYKCSQVIQAIVDDNLRF